MLTLSPDAQLSRNRVTVAGGNEYGDDTNQLNWPFGLDIHDDNQNLVIADFWNRSVVEWKMRGKNGKVIVGGRGKGNRLDQLYCPIDVLIDKETNSVLITNLENRRVLRWSRRQETTQGEVIVDNISRWRLTIDHQRHLYASDFGKDEVRRYTIEAKNGIVVAGGNGEGDQLNQLNFQTYLFVNEEQAIYMSDWNNHRVMKWNKDAKEDILVTGGQGKGSALIQLFSRQRFFVNTASTLYVADSWNHGVTRLSIAVWQGKVIVDVAHSKFHNGGIMIKIWYCDLNHQS